MRAGNFLIGKIQSVSIVLMNKENENSAERMRWVGESTNEFQTTIYYVFAQDTSYTMQFARLMEFVFPELEKKVFKNVRRSSVS